jgi:nicotinamide riboside transporter PnuC
MSTTITKQFGAMLLTVLVCSHYREEGQLWWFINVITAAAAATNTVTLTAVSATAATATAAAAFSAYIAAACYGHAGA